MIDVQRLREDPEYFKKASADKNCDPALVQKVLKVDKEWRERLQVVQSLRKERNALKRKARDDMDARTKAQKVKMDLKKAEPELKKVEEKRNALLKLIPNPAAEDVPVGKDESANKVIKKWGEIPNFDFRIRDHLEIGMLTGGIDQKKASEVVGARFNYLMGDVALLQFALVQFALETLTQSKHLEKIIEKFTVKVPSKPFVPVVPPVMVKPEVMDAMARLKPEEERFYISSDNWYLIGSAEHTLGPLHMGETLNANLLPLRYIGYSTSFRREAGSYGKDTRGIIRVHQFDKLEMEIFSLPEDSEKEQMFLLAIQEYFMQELKLPYQVLEVCTGDMGAPDYRQYDVEAWIPSQKKYRETHTADLMTDYQSRRLDIKYQRGQETGLVHMNDATAFAIGRTIVAILENYQNKDGSVMIPEVLKRFMHGKEKIEVQKS